MIEKLLKILEGHDKSKKIPGKQLSGMLDISRRTLRDYIETLRNRGVPIGSSWTPGDSGYWLEQDRVELAKMIVKRKKWLNGQYSTLGNMEKYYYQIGGQKSFLDELIEKSEEKSDCRQKSDVL